MVGWLALATEGRLQARVYHPTGAPLYTMTRADAMGGYVVQRTVRTPATTAIAVEREPMWTRQART